MDKLNLHDSLRIYLPGLFLSALFYLFITGKADDIGVIVIPALFVGLFLDKILYPYHGALYKRIATEKTFHLQGSDLHINQAIQLVVKIQLESRASADASKKDELEEIAQDYASFEEGKIMMINRALHSRSSVGEKLSFFRLPKSFGILYYNMSVICFGFAAYTFILLVYLCIQKDFFYMYIRLYAYDYMLPDIFFLAGMIFLKSSKWHFDDCYKKEFTFFSALADDDLKIMSDLTVTHAKI